jgi:hypothetical protein
MPQSKKPINPKIYRLLKPFVIKLVGDIDLISNQLLDFLEFFIENIPR